MEKPALLYSDTALVDSNGNRWLGQHMYGSHDYRNVAITYIDTSDASMKQVIIGSLVDTDI